MRCLVFMGIMAATCLGDNSESPPKINPADYPDCHKYGLQVYQSLIALEQMVHNIDDSFQPKNNTGIDGIDYTVCDSFGQAVKQSITALGKGVTVIEADSKAVKEDSIQTTNYDVCFDYGDDIHVTLEKLWAWVKKRDTSVEEEAIDKNKHLLCFNFGDAIHGAITAMETRVYGAVCSPSETGADLSGNKYDQCNGFGKELKENIDSLKKEIEKNGGGVTTEDYPTIDAELYGKCFTFGNAVDLNLVSLEERIKEHCPNA